MLDYQFFIRW